FSLIVVLLFAITASLLSVGKIFKEMPAQSMSRKPPKKAHVILVERMGFIWKRLSYKNKLIFRNIFLNKLRVILSSLGIMGCVGLLISGLDRKSTRLNSSHVSISYAVFCLKKKKIKKVR